MDELDHNLLDAWHRVYEQCRRDPKEARRRYERTLPGTGVDRPARAWCVAIRASDLRLMQAIGSQESAVGGESQDLKRWMRGLPLLGDAGGLAPSPSEGEGWDEGGGREIETLEQWIDGAADDRCGSGGLSESGGGCSGLPPGALGEGGEPIDPVGAQVAHEIVLDGELLRRLGGAVRIPYPGVPMTEAAKLLGRDYAAMRHWIPVGAGRSRVERDALAAKGRTYDGLLRWATFEKAGYALKVRYEPPGKHGRRGRETPVVWSDGALDPGAAKGLPPASWWGALWMSLADDIPDAFEQVVERVPKFLPYKGEMRFRGWLWRCPGLGSAGAGDKAAPSPGPSLKGGEFEEDNFRGCGRLVPKLYAPLPVWTVGRHLDLEEGLDVQGLSGQWYPGVMDRWAGRRRLACRQCWRVRNGGAAERHGWNEFVSHLSGGLLFGSEVAKPRDFEYERRRAFVKRLRKECSRKERPRKGVRPSEGEAGDLGAGVAVGASS